MLQASLCVGDLVRLGLSSIRVAGFTMQHGIGIGVSPGNLPCHTWGAHRTHLRSL